MRFICDRASLGEALNATSTVILARTPKPILQCVRVTAEKERLTLTAYDQEVGMRYRVNEVDVTKPGETLVRGDRLAAIVRESSDETLAFESGDDVLHIRGEDSHFQVYVQDVREFPPVPDLEGDASLTIKAGELQKIIGRTLFAAARENTRYAINGVLWEKQGKKLLLVATDGRRLAMCGATLEKSIGGDFEPIVPTKALNLIAKLHMDADDDIDVKFSESQAVLRGPRATISTVLVEGRFPKYRDVLPTDLDKRVELKRDDFHSAVKRAALLTNEESRGIRLHVSGEGIVLSSRAPEQGEAMVKLHAEYSGEAMDIGFNPAFLMDALKVCDETVTLEMHSQTKPGVLKSGADFLYVVMPVNLS